MAEDPDPLPKPHSLKPKAFDRVNAPGGASVDPNDIRLTLADNLNRANKAGLNDVMPPPPRRSRRRRDYLLAMVFGNLVLIVGTIIMPVFGAAGLIIYNVGLTWIVWGVMDDY
ncbi:hypothetical protein [Opitutus terrae]|uniref:hypothetical protein n=1 Tax=Opitutus terrae TaxID=107709 RepID=UPI0011D06981|nr:hypothetical protein [Opitutus terrae]